MTARRWRPAFIPASLAIIVAAALAVPLPLFLETPRDPVGLAARVTVEADGAEVDGDYLLLAVTLRPGTFARVVHALVDPGRSVVPQAAIVPPGEDPDVYFERQRRVFDETASVAAAVALDAAGYEIDPQALVGDGVGVVEVIAGTPAANRLEPGDVIVEIDGRPVRAFEDLRDVLPDEPGEPVDIVVERDGRTERIRLETALLETEQGAQAGLGIRGRTHAPRIDLPVGVEVDAGGIGGPSAGLMIALTIYDMAATDVDLAAGRLIAGTGSIRRDGSVGDVGGVRQKVVAAERADADVLLVPARLLGQAEAALSRGSELEVVAVASFADALEALRREIGAAAFARVA